MRNKYFRLYANAKINFSLDVIRKIGDRHELDMTIIPIKLANKIYIKENKNTEKDLIYIDNNIIQDTNVEKFLKMARQSTSLPFFIVKIKTNIPDCAGLGSSSADTAAIIKFLEKKYKINIEQLSEGIKRIGNDILPMYYNRNLRLFGEDEEIQFISSDLRLNKVHIIYNNIKLSTKEIFKIYDENPLITQYTKTFLLDNEKRGNALTDAAMRYSSDFKSDYEWCLNHYEKVIMTGAGSGIVIFDKLTIKDIVKLKLKFKKVITTTLNVKNVKC